MGGGREALLNIGLAGVLVGKRDSVRTEVREERGVRGEEGRGELPLKAELAVRGAGIPEPDMPNCPSVRPAVTEGRGVPGIPEGKALGEGEGDGAGEDEARGEGKGETEEGSPDEQEGLKDRLLNRPECGRKSSSSCSCSSPDSRSCAGSDSCWPCDNVLVNRASPPSDPVPESSSRSEPGEKKRGFLDRVNEAGEAFRLISPEGGDDRVFIPLVPPPLGNVSSSEEACSNGAILAGACSPPGSVEVRSEGDAE